MSWTATLRRFWLDVHLWLGVGLAVVVIPLGLSGSVLVWHGQAERWVHPHRYAVSGSAALSPSAYFEAPQTALGDRFAPTMARMPETAGDPVTVNARAKGRPTSGRPETRTVFLDPPTARVLDAANSRESVLGLTHILHGTLLIPRSDARSSAGWAGRCSSRRSQGSGSGGRATALFFARSHGGALRPSISTCITRWDFGSPFRLRSCRSRRLHFVPADCTAGDGGRPSNVAAACARRGTRRRSAWAHANER